MSLLSFLKPKSDPIPSPETRCQHRYDNRSRCRLPMDEASEFFCHRHLDSGVLPEPPMTPEQREAQLLELYREVMGGAKYLNSATAVNHVLDNLFRLTLLGRIPQRQASKLTTQLRASLTSIRMKCDEFRVSQDDIETLLSDIDSHRESLENETEVEPSQVAATSTDGLSQAETENPTAEPNLAHVAPHVYPELSGGASLHRDSDSGRTCAASSNFNNESRRAAPQPRQIELLKAEANRADRDPFFDFLTRADSASDKQHAPPANETAPPDLPEFSELRAAESRRRVADLVNGVWIGPKPNEINWDQLEQQIEFAEQTKPTPYPRRRSRWQTMIG